MYYFISIGRKALFLFLFFIYHFSSGNYFSAGDTFLMNDRLESSDISLSYLGILEDPSAALTIKEVSSPAFANKYLYTKEDHPMNEHRSSAYWLRFTLKNDASLNNKFLLEIFDHNINYVTVYVPDGNGEFKEYKAGNMVPFSLRTYHHKNFEFDLPVPKGEARTFYMRVKSANLIVLIPVIRSYTVFIGWALGEYIVLGIFYGILLMMAAYNLILFIAIRKKAYLYYVFYVLSICLFSACQTGLGYQYVWNEYPGFNNYGFGIFLYTAIMCALLFTKDFLDLKYNFPLLNKIIWGVILLRTLIFIAGLFYQPLLFTMSFDWIPLLIAYASGVIVYDRGNKGAKYFLFAYSLLFIGFLVGVLEQYGVIDSSVFTVYSLNIAIVLEIIFLSISLADKMRIEIKLKEDAQERVVVELKEKELLKDKVNKELESKVSERTEKLKRANELLAKQAEEITRMNLGLDLQNRDLKKNVSEISRDRVMKSHVDLSEFSKVYPDDLSCYRFLEDLKSESGFICKKCSSNNSGKGKETFDRRCTSCGYNESITANTIFHKLKFPIVKAFYMMYLVSNQKDTSLDNMSEMLDLRKNTCYNFKKKIQSRIKHKPSGKITSWDELILDSLNKEVN